jgi:hypothetical protein
MDTRLGFRIPSGILGIGRALMTTARKTREKNVGNHVNSAETGIAALKVAGFVSRAHGARCTRDSRAEAINLLHARFTRDLRVMIYALNLHLGNV